MLARSLFNVLQRYRTYCLVLSEDQRTQRSHVLDGHSYLVQILSSSPSKISQSAIEKEEKEEMESAGASVGINAESQLTMKLLELTRRTNYELVQENGQRRLTAPELSSVYTAERKKGCEIFLGRLPRDCYEDEIMPLLESIGRLLELRLMLDFSGSTRGYAFALFENSTIARNACRALDGYEIRTGHRIGVVKSIDNCRLFFGGVPKDKTKADFLQELGKILDGITNIYVYPNAHNRGQNRGFIFVEFKDHRSAAMARRKLIPGRVVLWNHEIAVDWADPEPGEPIDDDIMETVTALFVRNLSLDTSQQEIRGIFQQTTNVPILKLKKINHFAFIHYENRRLAQCVLDIMTQPGGIAEIHNWEIRWAKPIESNKKTERRNPPNAENTDISSVQNQPMSCRWPSTSSKVYKKTNRDNRNSDVYDYQQLLKNFVSENFNATCRFQCYLQIDQQSYTCKVTVETTSKILYEYESGNFQSQTMAIKCSAREVYFCMQRAVGNDESQPPYRNPHSWCNLSGFSNNKFEACR